jgi:peptide/nickel transport system permease protein
VIEDPSVIADTPAAVAESARPPAASAARATRTVRGYWRESLSRLAQNRVGIACGVLLIAFGAIGVLAPQVAALVTHQDPARQNLHAVFGTPSGAHLFGTDELGRDVLTRLIYGTRVTLGVAFLTIAMAVSVGTTVGMVAGYYSGVIDETLMRLVDMLLSIPPIFLFILLSILLQPNPVTLAAIIAFVGWGGVARLVRAETLSVKNRDYITATRSLGASDLRLLARHVLPNVLPIMIVAASLALGAIILVEAALDFLGLGIHPPTPSWGNMLTQADNYFFNSPHLVLYPGATIFLTVLATNLFGNALRDAFDPRVRHGK